MKKKILILGGSSEAFQLDKALLESETLSAITSLAGRTSLPRKPIGPYRTGGFGGAEGMASYILENDIDALIDATHPFAAKISLNASKAAKRTGCPLLHIWREAWQQKEGDQWTLVDSIKAAAGILTPADSPVFLTIGRLELAAFLERTDINFIARAIEPAKSDDPSGKDAAFYPANFKFIYEKGPFSLNEERALMKTHKIRTLISKNSGGIAAYAKLTAARELGLKVFMINRPPKPEPGPGIDVVSNVEDALTWLTERGLIN